MFVFAVSTSLGVEEIRAEGTGDVGRTGGVVIVRGGDGAGGTVGARAVKRSGAREQSRRREKG